MKYIFDFDDTLFNTKKLKKRISFCLREVGIIEDLAKNYYEYRDKSKPFSLKSFLDSFLKQQNIRDIYFLDLYNKIMNICHDLINKKLIQIVKNAEKDNLFIVTKGDKNFQMDKIEKSGISSLFKEIFITSSSKKDIIEKICSENQNEEVLFIDNKAEFFEDLDFNKYPNLKTILYTGQEINIL